MYFLCLKKYFTPTLDKEPNKKAAAQGRFSLLPLCSSLILPVVSVEFSQISLVASRSQSASSAVR